MSYLSSCNNQRRLLRAVVSSVMIACCWVVFTAGLTAHVAQAAVISTCPSSPLTGSLGPVDIQIPASNCQLTIRDATVDSIVTSIAHNGLVLVIDSVVCSMASIGSCLRFNAALTGGNVSIKRFTRTVSGAIAGDYYLVHFSGSAVWTGSLGLRLEFCKLEGTVNNAPSDVNVRLLHIQAAITFSSSLIAFDMHNNTLTGSFSTTSGKITMFLLRADAAITGSSQPERGINITHNYASAQLNAESLVKFRMFHIDSSATLSQLGFIDFIGNTMEKCGAQASSGAVEVMLVEIEVITVALSSGRLRMRGNWMRSIFAQSNGAAVQVLGLHFQNSGITISSIEVTGLHMSSIIADATTTATVRCVAFDGTSQLTLTGEKSVHISDVSLHSHRIYWRAASLSAGARVVAFRQISAAASVTLRNLVLDCPAKDSSNKGVRSFNSNVAALAYVVVFELAVNLSASGSSVTLQNATVRGDYVSEGTGVSGGVRVTVLRADADFAAWQLSIVTSHVDARLTTFSSGGFAELTLVEFVASIAGGNAASTSLNVSNNFFAPSTSVTAHGTHAFLYVLLCNSDISGFEKYELSGNVLDSVSVTAAAISASSYSFILLFYFIGNVSAFASPSSALTLRDNSARAVIARTAASNAAVQLTLFNGAVNYLSYITVDGFDARDILLRGKGVRAVGALSSHTQESATLSA